MYQLWPNQLRIVITEMIHIWSKWELMQSEGPQTKCCPENWKWMNKCSSFFKMELKTRGTMTNGEPYLPPPELHTKAVLLALISSFHYQTVPWFIDVPGLTHSHQPSNSSRSCCDSFVTHRKGVSSPISEGVTKGASFCSDQALEHLIQLTN